MVNTINKKTQLPRYFFNSALFPAIRGEKNIKSKKDVFHFKRKNFTVISENLTQIDLATNMGIVKLAKHKSLLHPLRFSMAELLSAMDRKDGGKTRQYIANSLQRCNHYLCYTTKQGKTFEGYVFDRLKILDPMQYEVRFNPFYIDTFYQADESCEVNTDILLNIMPSLKSWLYGFMMANPDRQHIRIETLQRLTGKNYHKQIDFKKAIKRAFSALYKLKLIAWRHGIMRDGTVFWSINHDCNFYLLKDNLIRDRCYNKSLSPPSMSTS